MIPDALGARTGAFLEPFFPWATIRDLRILNRYRKVLKRFKLSGFLEGLYFSKGVTIVLIVIIELYLLCTFKGHGTATVENGFHNADWLDHRINRVPPSRLFSWVLLIHPLVSSPMNGSSPFEDHFLILRHTKIDRRWFTTRRTRRTLPFFPPGLYWSCDRKRRAP